MEVDFLPFPCLGRAMPAGTQFVIPGALFVFDWAGVSDDGRCQQEGEGTGVVDIETGAILFETPVGGFTPLILSRDGRILGTFGWYPEDDAPLTRVFDTNTNEIIFEYPGGRAEVSGDGTMVLVGNDPTFLYDLSSGDRLQTYQGAFVRMRFLPNESRVVGVGPAGVVQIFDTESGAEVMRLRGHTSQIRTTSVTTGGNILVSSGDIAQMSPRGLGRAPSDGPHVDEPDRMAGISQSRSSKRISRRGPTLRCRARS